MPLNRHLVLSLFLAPAFLQALTPTTVTLSAGTNPSTYGSADTLTARVTPDTATGKITFFDGAAILGVTALNAGQATLTTKLLQSGTRVLKARYSGDGSDASSTSPDTAQTVTATAAGGFQPAVSYAAGDSPNGMAIGDFNRDGKLDLAVSNFQGLNVLLGNGDGTFQAPINTAAITSANAVAVGDFDGDGRTDLAVSSGRSVMILLGKGDGTFQPPATISLAAQTSVVAVGDLNNDGKADLVVGNGSNIGVLLGVGDGSFLAPVQYAVQAAYSTNVSLADLNGDGNTDVVVGAFESGPVIFSGNGDGTLLYQGALPNLSDYNEFSWGSIAVGDFDGDGKQDIVNAIFQTGLSVYLGNGNGSFQAPLTVPLTLRYTGTLAVGDFNGDGKLDLAVSDAPSYTLWGFTNSVRILLGNGDGSFQAPVFYNAGTAPTFALAVGDFNGDGRADIAAAIDPQANLAVLLGQNASNPTVSAISVNPSSGSGPSKLFSFTYSDSAGAADLAEVTAVLTNGDEPIFGISQCIVSYNPSQHTLTLWDDSDQKPAGGIPIGTGYQQNSACVLDGSASSATTAGNTLTLNLFLGFRQRFPVRTQYGEAVSATGSASGPQLLGNWLSVSVGPQVTLTAPPNTARRQTLTFVGSEANGAADLNVLYADVTSSATVVYPAGSVSSCLVMVEVPSGDISLLDDGGTVWLGPIVMGGAGTLQNSQCIVYGPQSVGTLSAFSYSAALSIQLLGSGEQNIFAAAQATSGNFPNQKLGTWTTYPRCDITNDGSTNISDIQGIIDEALGSSNAADDLNNDQLVNIVDVQIVIGAVLGPSCAAM